MLITQASKNLWLMQGETNHEI